MNRLRDDLNANDPRAREAGRLLRAVAPLADDPQRQRRVRARLGVSRARSLAALVTRPVVVVATLLATVGVAAAMAGGGWSYARQQVARLISIDGAPKARLATPRPAASRAHAGKADPIAAPVEAAPSVAAVVEPTVAPVPEVPAVSAVPAVPAVVERREQRPEVRRRAGGPAKAAPSLPAPLAAGTLVPTGPGASLMIEALQARRAGDAARTERLLARYRTEYPNGALQEEALVLSLEAATQQESGRAQELARTYLTRFPNGRFRERVQQMLSAKAP